MASHDRVDTLLACAAALVVGSFVSLFTAGPALFADGPFAVRVDAVGISVALFAIVGFVIGLAAPGAWKPAAVCLGFAAVPITIFFGWGTLTQPPMALLSAGFALGDAAGGILGVWAGARIRALRSRARGSADPSADARPSSAD